MPHAIFITHLPCSLAAIAPLAGAGTGATGCQQVEVLRNTQRPSPPCKVCQNCSTGLGPGGLAWQEGTSQILIKSHFRDWPGEGGSDAKQRALESIYVHTLAPASSDRRCLKAGQAAAWLGRGLRLPTPTRTPQLALPPGGLRGGARRCPVPFSGHFTTHGSSPLLRCALPPLWQGKPNVGREGAAGGPGILPGALRGTAMGRRSLFAVQNLAGTPGHSRTIRTDCAAAHSPK